MAVSLNSGFISDLDEIEQKINSGELTLSDISAIVAHTGGFEHSEVSVDQMFTGKNKKVKSFADLKKALAANDLMCKIGGESVPVKAEELFVSVTSEVAPILSPSAGKNARVLYSSIVYEDGMTDAERAAIPYGRRRLMAVTAKEIDVTNLFTKPEDEEPQKYIYALVDGEWDFYPIENIFVLDGLTYTPITEKKFATEAELAAQNVVVKTKNGEKTITSIVATRVFSMSVQRVAPSGVGTSEHLTSDLKDAVGNINPIVCDTVDLETLTLQQYQLTENGQDIEIEFSNSDSFAPKVEPKMVKTRVEADWVERSLATVKTREPGITDSKEVEVPKIKAQMYTAAFRNDGTHLRLRLMGTSEPVLLSIKAGESQVFEDKDCTKPIQSGKDLTIFIGKSLYVKIDGKIVKTEPLTEQEALLTYRSHKTLHKSIDIADRYSDDAYLRLANGKYVKEQDYINPIAYNFVRDPESADYDAYICYYKDAKGEVKTVILPKDFAIGKAATLTTADGQTINIAADSQFYKIKRSTSALADSDIIQTTSTGSACEKAETLVKQPVYGAVISSVKKKDDAEAILKRAKAEFIKLYKEGVYDIDEVVIDGKVIKLDQIKHSDDARFMYSDTLYLDDPLGLKPQYKYMKDGEMRYNPKTGKVEGGPEFDVKQANINFIKDSWKDLFTPTIYGLGLASVFGVFCAPVGIALGVGVAALWLGVPLYNWIKKMVYTKRLSHFKSHDNELRRKMLKEKQVEHELSSLYSNVTESLAKKEVEITEGINQQEHDLTFSILLAEKFKEIDAMDEAALIKELGGGDKYKTLDKARLVELLKEKTENELRREKDPKKALTKYCLDKLESGNLKEYKKFLKDNGFSKEFIAGITDIEQAKDIVARFTVEQSINGKLGETLSDADLVKLVSENKTIADHVKEKRIAEERAAAKRKFLADYEELEHRVDASFAEGRFLVDFEAVNGTAKVTKANAHLYAEYAIELQDLNKKLAKLKKGKATQEEIAEVQAQIDGLVEKYQRKGETRSLSGAKSEQPKGLIRKIKAKHIAKKLMDEAEERDELRTKMEKAKAFMLIQENFGEADIETTFTDEEQADANLMEAMRQLREFAQDNNYSIKYDPVKDEIVVEYRGTLDTTGMSKKAAKKELKELKKSKTLKKVGKDLNDSLKTVSESQTIRGVKLKPEEELIIATPAGDSAGGTTPPAESEAERARREAEARAAAEAGATPPPPVKRTRTPKKPAERLTDEEAKELQELLETMNKFNILLEKIFKGEKLTDSELSEFETYRELIKSRYETYIIGYAGGYKCDTETLVIGKKGRPSLGFAIKKDSLQKTRDKLGTTLGQFKSIGKKKGVGTLTEKAVLKMLNDYDFKLEEVASV